MKQLPKTEPRHSIRITESSYQIVHKLAKSRDLSDILALQQIIEDYVTLTTKQNLK